MIHLVKKLEKNSLNVLLGFAVCLSVPPHIEKKTFTCMEFGFPSNFCFGWEGHGMISGSLLLVIWGVVDFSFFVELGV